MYQKNIKKRNKLQLDLKSVDDNDWMSELILSYVQYFDPDGQYQSGECDIEDSPIIGILWWDMVVGSTVWIEEIKTTLS